MRHNNKINSLGKTASHRKAMLSNMATSLIKHKRIKTTLAKAKVLRRFVEPIINRSKEDSTHNRRIVFKYIQDKFAVSELFRTVAPKITERNGGYTRILKLGHRMGDNAEICMIELVDFNTTYLSKAKQKASAKKKSRRGGSKKQTEKVVEEVKKVDETKVEENTSKEVDKKEE